MEYVLWWSWPCDRITLKGCVQVRKLIRNHCRPLWCVQTSPQCDAIGLSQNLEMSLPCYPRFVKAQLDSSVQRGGLVHQTHWNTGENSKPHKEHKNDPIAGRLMLQNKFNRENAEDNSHYLSKCGKFRGFCTVWQAFITHRQDQGNDKTSKVELSYR